MSAPAAHDVDALRHSWTKAGQGHVFTFWDQLSPSDQSALYHQLLSINPTRVNSIHAAALEADKAAVASTADDIEPPPAHHTGTVIGRDADAAEWTAAGLAAVREGKVAVVLMAGGQGTRLGSSAPKGCYDIGLASHKSLFQLQAERIRRLEHLANEGGDTHGEIPWYIMTSGPTRKPTEAFFEAHDYFGLRKDNVVFFEQGVLPCLTDDGKVFLDSPSSVAVAPDGNGGLYAALRAPLSSTTSSTTTPTTVLSDLARRNIAYVHCYGVDNCLVRVADPTFVGYCAGRDADCGVKVVKKTDPSESVGVVAVKRGKYAVVEYSEISTAMAEQRVNEGTATEGDLAFRAANVANHFFTRAFLERVCALDEAHMPFHIARKKIPHVDLSSSSGEVIKPTSPNGMKLELFVFDVLAFAERFALLEVARSSEFSPLKNAPGAGVDCPETSVRDLVLEHARWLGEAGASVELHEGEGGAGMVELSPLVSYAGEGLERVKGRRIVRGGVVERVEDLDALCA
ncbi:hypothetical protein JCM8208_006955 [Rhodotorula glutinis]